MLRMHQGKPLGHNSALVQLNLSLGPLAECPSTTGNFVWLGLGTTTFWLTIGVLLQQLEVQKNPTRKILLLTPV